MFRAIIYSTCLGLFQLSFSIQRTASLRINMLTRDVIKSRTEDVSQPRRLSDEVLFVLMFFSVKTGCALSTSITSEQVFSMSPDTS